MFSLFIIISEQKENSMFIPFVHPEKIFINYLSFEILNHDTKFKDFNLDPHKDRTIFK